VVWLRVNLRAHGYRSSGFFGRQLGLRVRLFW